MLTQIILHIIAETLILTMQNYQTDEIQHLAETSIQTYKYTK